MFYSPSQKGFFDTELFEDCKPVSNELHNLIYDGVVAGGTIENDENGMPVIVPPVAEVLDIETQFKHRLYICNNDYERAVSTLRSTYPMSESITWTIQIQEARVYDQWRTAGRIDPVPTVPFITELNARRIELGVGTGLDDLVDRIIANDSVYSPAIAAMTAERHRAEKAMMAALASVDEAGIQAVTWDYMSILAAIPQ